MTTITEYLAEQKRLAEAATEGPWALTEFIAAARESVPRLVAALEAVEDQVRLLYRNAEPEPGQAQTEVARAYVAAARLVSHAIEAALGGETDAETR